MLYSMRRELLLPQDPGLDFTINYRQVELCRELSGRRALNQLISSGALGLFMTFVTLVAIMVIMPKMNVQLALVAVVPFVHHRVGA